jgi:hypothetical protein
LDPHSAGDRAKPGERGARGDRARGTLRLQEGASRQVEEEQGREDRQVAQDGQAVGSADLAVAIDVEAVRERGAGGHITEYAKGIGCGHTAVDHRVAGFAEGVAKVEHIGFREPGGGGGEHLDLEPAFFRGIGTPD